MRTIRRTISKYSRLWDLQRNPRQTDPAGTRRRGQRPAVNDLSEDMRAKLALLERADEDNAEAVNDLSEDMREKPDNLYEAIAARGEGAAGAHPETPSSFVRDNPHEKTVCKRLLADGFYICSMHFDRPAVSETGSYRYKYCNDIHFGRIDHFDRDRWLSLQCSWLLFKCILILLFPDGAKDVF